MSTDQAQSAFRNEVTRLLYTGAVGTLLTGGLLAALLTLLLWNEVSAGLVLGWLALVEGAYLVRLGVARAYQRAISHDTPAWLDRFRLGVIASSFLWGAGAGLMFPSGNVAGQALLLMTIAGLVAGSTTSYVIDRVTLVGFVLPLTVPVVIRLMAEATGQSILMGLMLTLFLAYIIGVVLKKRGDLHEIIRLRLSALRRDETSRTQNEFLNAILECEPDCVKVLFSARRTTADESRGAGHAGSGQPGRSATGGLPAVCHAGISRAA